MRVDDERDVGRALHERPEPFLRLRQRVAWSRQLADVARDLGHPTTAPVESNSGDAVTTTWMTVPSLCRRMVRRLLIDVPLAGGDQHLLGLDQSVLGDDGGDVRADHLGGGEAVDALGALCSTTR